MDDSRTKYLTATLEKASNARSGADGTFVLSNQAVDRDGDIILADGWDLRNFKANPIALWQHDHRAPVGRWENLRIDGDRLLADLQLASTNLAKMAKQLIADGVLRAVSVGFRPQEVEPRDEDAPHKGFLIKSAELLEASLVSVGSNPEALLLAKNLGIDPEIRRLILDDVLQPSRKSASSDVLRRAKLILGESADTPTKPKPNRGSQMTLSEKVKSQREALVKLRDALTVATSDYADDPTDELETQITELSDQIEAGEKKLEVLERAERNLAAALDKAPIDDTTKATPSKPQAPGYVRARGTDDHEGGRLLFLKAACKALAFSTGRSVEDVQRTMWPDVKGLDMMVKADVLPADTGVEAWAGHLLATQVTGFVDALTKNSVYGALAARGVSFTFSGGKSIKIPNRDDSSVTLNGGFIEEGAPIRVGKAALGSATLTYKAMKVITTYTDEMLRSTAGQIETIVRDGIVNDTRNTLDTLLLDATAADDARPAGLLVGVTVGTSAGDTSDNILTDLKALIDDFTSYDEAGNVVIIMNPLRRLGLLTVTNASGNRIFADEVSAGTIMGFPIVTSANVVATEVHAVDAGDFATASGAPEFAVSNSATLHMEDTTPLEIVSGTPTTADPVRSLFQTDTVGLRMVLPVTWVMRRAGRVSSLDSVTW